MASDETEKTQIAFSAPNGVAIGTRIVGGTYEIEEHIATGGMGEVYRGLNIHTGEPVAIKIVLAALAHDKKIIALFQKEAKVLGRLHHDAIVRYNLFTVDDTINRACLVMEFVGGRPLSDFIDGRPMPLEDVRVLLRRLAPGLHKAHELGVVHRDLSPDNVIIQDNLVSHAKIIDFGIAKSEKFGGGTLLGGQFAGKYGYVSPEQLGRFQGVIEGQSDIYSLGLVAAAAAMGHQLDMGDNPGEAVDRRNQVPDLTYVYPELRPVLERMLQPNPAHRPATMLEVIDLLDKPPVTASGGTFVPPTAPEPTIIAPMGSLPPAITRPPTNGFSASEPTSNPVSDSDSPFGVSAQPSVAPVTPAAAPTAPPEPVTPHSSRRGSPFVLLSVLAVVLGGGGAGLYFTGQVDALRTQISAMLGGGTTDGDDDDRITDNPDPVTPVENGTESGSPPSQVASNPNTDDGVTPPTNPQNKPDTETIVTALLPNNETNSTTDKPSASTVDPPSQTPNPPVQPPVNSTTVDSPQPSTGNPALDAIAERVAWMQSHNLPTCAYATVQSATPSTFVIEGFAPTADPFWTLHDEFQTRFGTEPDIGVRLIKEAQCPVLDFLSRLDPDRSRSPFLSLDKTVLKSGEPIRGLVEGIGSREVWLFLVDSEGAIYDLSGRLVPEGSGRSSFSVALRPNDPDPGEQLVPQMIVAVATDGALSAARSAPGANANDVLPQVAAELRSTGRDGAAAVGYFRFSGD